MDASGSRVVNFVGLKSLFKLSNVVVFLSELTFIIDSLGSKLRFKLLNSGVKSSDFNFIFLSVSGHIDAGVRLRFHSG